jgi:hypothetical protein
LRPVSTAIADQHRIRLPEETAFVTSPDVTPVLLSYTEQIDHLFGVLFCGAPPGGFSPSKAASEYSNILILPVDEARKTLQPNMTVNYKIFI